MKWALLGGLGGCLALGLTLGHLWPGHPETSRLLFHLGVAGLVGLLTNMLAVRMVFDYLYLPLVRVRIPGSGLVPSNLETILEQIGQGLATEVFTPQAVAKEVERQGVATRVGELLSHKLQDEQSRQQLFNLVSRPLLGWIRSDRFYSLVRGWIAGYARGNFLVRLARLTGAIDYDELTCRVIIGLEGQVRAFGQDGGGQRVGERLQHLLQEAVRDETRINRALGGILTPLLQEFDFGEAVKRGLGERPPQEVQGFFRAMGGRYLDWIELFGGFIGAGVGVATWATTLLV